MISTYTKIQQMKSTHKQNKKSINKQANKQSINQKHKHIRTININR